MGAQCTRKGEHLCLLFALIEKIRRLASSE